MEPIDVFIWIDCFHQSGGPEMRRQGLLDQDPIDGWIVIEFFDVGNQLFFGAI